MTAHAAAEEESLYAVMLQDPDMREEGTHSVSEHKEIDDFLLRQPGVAQAVAFGGKKKPKDVLILLEQNKL